MRTVEAREEEMETPRIQHAFPSVPDRVTDHLDTAPAKPAEQTIRPEEQEQEPEPTAGAPPPPRRSEQLRLKDQHKLEDS